MGESRSTRVAALLRAAARVVLGVFLVAAGTTHLTVFRAEFRAQVPAWVPLDADLVVVGSGVVEIALGLALLVWRSRRAAVGVVTALFFVAIFPGNLWQYLDGVDGFGLDTDAARLQRLFFQPVLVLWALWCTGAPPFRRRVSGGGQGRAEQQAPVEDELGAGGERRVG